MKITVQRVTVHVLWTFGTWTDGGTGSTIQLSMTVLQCNMEGNRHNRNLQDSGLIADDMTP